MKETIIALLQQRMDKCTTEQFWAVASLTAADAFVVSGRDQLLQSLPRWVLLSLITFASAYGVLFVIQRHLGFYRNRDAMARLLADERDVPDFLRDEPRRRSFNSLSGVMFYVGWILLGCIICYAVTLKT